MLRSWIARFHLRAACTLIRLGCWHFFNWSGCSGRTGCVTSAFYNTAVCMKVAQLLLAYHTSRQAANCGTHMLSM